MQGRRPSAPRGVDLTPLAVLVGGNLRRPGSATWRPLPICGPSDRPARSEVGLRKLAAGRGGAQLAEEGVKFREAAG